MGEKSLEIMNDNNGLPYLDAAECAFTMNYSAVAQKLSKQLIELRNINEKKHYPIALAKVILHEVYSIKEFWNSYVEPFNCDATVSRPDINDLNPSFVASKEAAKSDRACIVVAGSYFSNQLKHYSNSYAIHKSKLRHNADKLWDNGCVIVDIDFNAMKNTAWNAASGNNAAVEELEYAYICYMCLNYALCGWSILGSRGRNRVYAYLEFMHYPVTHFRLIYQLLISIDGAFHCFRTSIGVGIGGSQQCAVNGCYSKLSPLW